MSTKLTVSLDETNTAAVDEAVKRQDALNRTLQHQDKIRVELENSYSPPSPIKGKLIYNSVCYLALFGLIFALIGWTIGEIPIQKVESHPFSIFTDAYSYCNFIIESVKKGELSQEEGDKRIKEVETSLKENSVYGEFVAGIDVFKKYENDNSTTIMSFLFYISIAVFIGGGLAMADSFIEKNWEQTVKRGSIGMLIGLVGGISGAMLGGLAYTQMGGGVNLNTSEQIFARAFAWGIIGLFVAIAPGIVMRSPKKFSLGLVGGLAGGIFGGLLFDPLSMLGLPTWCSRMIAVLSFGIMSGVALGLLENVVKQGWLKVLAGVIAGKQFILYRNPTYIGSSPKCEIYLFKDPKVSARHAAISNNNGTFVLENMDPQCVTLVNGTPTQKHSLQNGDHINIGATHFAFGVKNVEQRMNTR